MNDESNSLVISPRIRPRGVSDFCLCAFVVLPIQFLVLSVLPATIAFLLTRSVVFAFAAAVVVYFTFLLFVVSRISLSPDGIRFHRILGVPKFLRWEHVISVELAPQRELVLRGWLWPMLPAREMTASFTSLQHYRIAWDSGFCYYPPADCALFEQYVSANLKTSDV